MRFDIVIPVYNEEECILETLKRLELVRLQLMGFDTHFIFVNDGSRDSTFDLLSQEAKSRSHIHVLNLSRNFGHQIALTAGLDYATGDYVGIIDGDLQDPPELFLEMIKEMQEEGLDVLYGQRRIRNGETFFKKTTAKAFYFILSRLCDVPIPRDTGDFRLISKPVLLSLQQMREKHRFVRGLVPFAGFRQKSFLYDRKERFAGSTKYPLVKMINFALDAIFSFSTKPLKLIRYFGFISLFASFYLIVNTIIIKFYSSAVPGYSSTLVVIVFFGSIQILAISILGEYVGRIFEESKRRPLYFIKDVING
jgi:glycosyltransferase involved in cell wall biosynthesis